MKKPIYLGLFIALCTIFSNYLSAYTDNCDSPLKPNSWGLEFQGGVYPTIWGKPGHIFLESCDFLTDQQALPSTDLVSS